MKFFFRAVFQNVALLLLSLCFSLLLLEFAFRLLNIEPLQKKFSARYSVHEMSPNLRLLYKPRKNAENDAYGVLNKINSAGFRDRDFPIQKDPEKKRIIFLGDSVVYGYGIELKDTLPKQLEAVFDKHRKPIEVLNFGVSGYEAEQEVEFFKDSGLIYQPDMVIVGYTLNDVRCASLELDKLSEEAGNNVLESGKNPFKNFLTFLYDYSYLFNFLDRKLKIQKKVKELKSYRTTIRGYVADRNDAVRDAENSDYKQLAGAVRAEARTLSVSDVALSRMLEMTGLETASDIGRSHWGVAKESFLELRKLSEEYGFRVVIVIFPYFGELGKYALTPVHRFLKNEFQLLGFNVIDALGFSREVSLKYGARKISGDGVHLTPLGGSLLASYIFQQLDETEPWD